MGADADGARRVISGVVRLVLGPWPFFPWVMFAIGFFFWLFQNMQVSLFGQYDSCRFVCVPLPSQFAPGISGQYGDSALRPFDPILVFGNALVTSLAIALILWGFSRVAPKNAEGCPSRGLYLLGLLTASVVGGILRIYVLSPVLNSSPEILLQGILPNAARMFVSITVVQSISGVLTLRYARQTAVATAALDTVIQQQRLVVEADERARRNVAEFLHDRVQADLLVVAMELRGVSHDADPQLSARLEHAISDLERIRSTEVRSASRRLSPAFGSVGLDTALQDLADSWDSALRVRVTLDPASRDVLLHGHAPRDLLVAVYRVAEQATLNAAAHGRASRVDVALTMPEQGTILLTVTDDGRGLPSGLIVRGAGSAIMDAWCAVVHGSWRWVPGARGARLEATFSV